MEKVAVGLYGAGGFGREVAALLPSIVLKLFPNLLVQNILIVFIDDNRNLNKVDNKLVMSKDDFLNLPEYELYYCVTISDCKIRKSIVLEMERTTAKPLTLIFNETLILNDTIIGVGSIVMPGSKISTSVVIRNHVQINFNSYIAHDCILDNFVTISPGVICCGNTTIGEASFIGAGCVIKQGSSLKMRTIGANTILGIGSNLVTDLPDEKIYAGNPAKSLDEL